MTKKSTKEMTSQEKWNKNHEDKIKQYKRNWARNHKEHILANKREWWNRKTPEQKHDYEKKYHSGNYK